ncbi:hypothetical protein IIA15_08035 [candidate division TA06 bacterium]|nr:hypothetical protein [candidate division TA06 bacterium]
MAENERKEKDPARLKYEGWKIGSGLQQVEEGTVKSRKNEEKNQGE